MADLSTSSKHSEFEHDLRAFANMCETMSSTFGKYHNDRAKSNIGNYYRGSGSETVDSFSLYIGFTMVVSQLAQIVEQIGELEEVASSEEDEGLDESEIYHTFGELFALKRMYIQLRHSVENVESERVLYTEEGHNPRYFMTDVLNGHGIPNIRNRRFNNGGLIVNGNITSSQIKFNNVFAASPAVSSTPPAVPNLP